MGVNVVQRVVGSNQNGVKAVINGVKQRDIVHNFDRIRAYLCRPY